MPLEFLLAIVFAVALLLAVNCWIRVYPKSTGVAIVICTALGFAPCGLLAYCIPLHLQAVALVLALPLAYLPRHGRSAYHIGSTAATLAIWLYAAITTTQEAWRYDEWERQNPFESMEERLPEPTRGGSADGPLWSEVNDNSGSGRAWSLQVVHMSREHLFHGTVGFGTALRGRIRATPEDFEPDPATPVPQPERHDLNAVSFDKEVPDEFRTPFPSLHAKSLLDFVYPDGFGYAPTRRFVAGFRPHRFSKVPEPVEKWEVRRLELVGLLLNPTPRVYVSDNLPRMEEVKRLPTREPNGSEADGLKAIRGGEDLHSRGDDRAARMVGAIRSVNQCVACHGGQRGDLLGAFSYHLRRKAD